MARDEKLKTHRQNIAIIPSTKGGDAAGDVALAIYDIDSDPMAPGTARFSVDEDGDVTCNSITVTTGITQDEVTVTSNDVVDGVVDMLMLTHSSSDNNATAGDGIGITFDLENATGTSTVEEWGSIDVLSTTITNGSEDADMVVNLMAGGTVVPAMTLDSSDQSLTVGQNVTDADGFNKLRIYPTTTARGGLILSCATHASADRTTTITQSTDQAGSYTYTIPNAGASCEFVMAAGAQTIAGAKAFSDNMTAGPASATAWTLTKTTSAADTAGGAITITSGAGGTGATNGTAGAAVTLVGGAAGVVTGSARTGGAGGGITLTGTVGGNGSTSGSGGAGGGLTLTAGNGGTTATGTGGAAGAVAITAGNGGAVTDAGTGIAGGAVTITAGNGAAVTTGTGLAGGALTLVAGNGGNGSVAGGNGGIVSFTPGSAGTGGTGVAGVIRLNGNAVKKGTVTDYDVQHATATIAALLGGIVTHNSKTGGSTLVTPTGAEISAGIAEVATGDSFSVFYHNRGDQTSTVTAGASGVTVAGGTVAITTTKTAILTFICTGANTWTCYVAAGA